MPAPSWYTENSRRAYPFVKGTVGLVPGLPDPIGLDPHAPPDIIIISGVTVFNLPDDVIVDAGFVAGPSSRFDAAVHTVWLDQIWRNADVFYFVFRSDAPDLYDVPLLFTRNLLTDGPYAAEFSDSSVRGRSDSSESGEEECEAPLWSGFLVTGDLAVLDEFMPTGALLRGGPGGGVVEPALVQNLAGAAVSRLAVANTDRVRTDAPEGCTEPTYPFPTGGVYVYDRCIVGRVCVSAGYNASVSQSTEDNSITLAGVVGGGEGEPCEEVPLFPGEEPPGSESLLSGGPRCNETVRSINGIGGPTFTFEAGDGVLITPLPESNTVLINVNLASLAACGIEPPAPTPAAMSTLSESL